MTVVAVSSLVIITGLHGGVVVGSIIAQVPLGPPIGERNYSKDGRARVLISTSVQAYPRLVGGSVGILPSTGSRHSGFAIGRMDAGEGWKKFLF